MSTVATTREIDEWTLRLVSAFVHDAKQMLQQDIPVEIVGICATFAVMVEYFELNTNHKNTDSYRLESNKRTIVKMNGFSLVRSRRGYETVMGNVSVHSLSQKTHCWTFEVLQYDMSMCFGIAAEGNGDKYFAFAPHHKMHQGTAWRSSSQKYPFKIDKGSVVKMELNLKRKELTFYVDGECLGVAFDDIKCGEDRYYRMAIEFQFSGSSARLVDYWECDAVDASYQENT